MAKNLVGANTLTYQSRLSLTQQKKNYGLDIFKTFLRRHAFSQQPYCFSLTTCDHRQLNKQTADTAVSVIIYICAYNYAHRYRRPKIDCLSFVMCPLLAQLKIGFFSSFLLLLFTFLMKQTRQALSSLYS